MPIYEYVCEDCGEKYEKLVRSSTAKVDLVCPNCGSSQARKALSLFGSTNAGGTSQISGNYGSAAGACAPSG